MAMLRARIEQRACVGWKQLFCTVTLDTDTDNGGESIKPSTTINNHQQPSSTTINLSTCQPRRSSPPSSIFNLIPHHPTSHRKRLSKMGGHRCYFLSLWFLVNVVTVVPYALGFTTHERPVRSNRQSTTVFMSEYEEPESKSTSRSKRIRPRRLSTSASQQTLQEKREEAKVRQEKAASDPSLLSSQHFAEQPLHPNLKRALVEDLGLATMTQIQARTYPLISNGTSILAQAKTGTGKTIAFLLPALERMLESNNRLLYVPGKSIGMLVVAPTRELAQQIADTASILLSHFSQSEQYSVACFYGGTKMGRDMNLLTSKPLPTVLVATPGRLLDHLKDTRLRGRKFSDVMKTTQICVLDEYDYLLDLGFKREILKILSYLPRSHKRQTLLFSATVGGSATTTALDILGDDYQVVSCLGDDNNQAITNTRVEQSYVVLSSMENYVTSMWAALEHATEEQPDDCKILLFLPTAKLVSFLFLFFEQLKQSQQQSQQLPLYQLHSRMTQSARQRSAESFGSARRAILLSTDVSSRGMDFPDVTHVIQWGLPDSNVKYIHRLGRTARAGAVGRGLQVLLPFEAMAARRLEKRGIDPVENTRLLVLNEDHTDAVEQVWKKTRNGDAGLTPAAEAAYKSFVAQYIGKLQNRNRKMISNRQVVDAAESLSRGFGLERPPRFEVTVANKLGIEALVEVEHDT